MSRVTNHDFEDDIEVYFGGYGSKKYTASVRINFDYTPPVAATGPTYDSGGDPGWGAEVSVNSVHLRRNGEDVECPKWLEEIILDAVDEEALLDWVDRWENA